MIKLLFALSLLGTGAEEPTTVEEPTVEVATVEEEKQEETNWMENFLAEYFSADKVAMYMSWIAYIGTIVGLVGNLKKLKKQNNLTLKNVSDDVQSKLQSVVGKEVTEQVERFLPNIVDTQEKTNVLLKQFSKILALSQENTPESRVAILNIIEELGTISKDITESAKEVVQEEVKAIEEHKEEVETKLDEIIDQYDGTSI